MAVSDAHMQTALVFLVKVNIIKFVLEMRWLNYFSSAFVALAEQNPGVQRWLHRTQSVCTERQMGFINMGKAMH